jgi:hypothetical protein
LSSEQTVAAFSCNSAEPAKSAIISIWQPGDVASLVEHDAAASAGEAMDYPLPGSNPVDVHAAAEKARFRWEGRRNGPSI